jgi:hypothetical protein
MQIEIGAMPSKARRRGRGSFVMLTTLSLALHQALAHRALQQHHTKDHHAVPL